MKSVFIKILLFDESDDEDVESTINVIKAGKVVYDAFEVAKCV